MTPPDIIGYNHYDYGNRVGIWRVMALLDRLQIRATVALNARCVRCASGDRSRRASNGAGKWMRVTG